MFLLEFGLARENPPTKDVNVVQAVPDSAAPSSLSKSLAANEELPQMDKRRADREDPDGRCIFTPQKRAKPSSRAQQDAQRARKAVRPSQLRGITSLTRADSSSRPFK